MLKARWSNRGQRKGTAGPRITSSATPVIPAIPAPDVAAKSRKPDLLKRPAKLWYALRFEPSVVAQTDAALNHIEPVGSTLDQTEPALDHIALQCMQVTDYVSLAPPDAVLLEVRGSLRYFRGIQNIRARLRDILQAMPYREAITPSPAASLLLARQGAPCLVADPLQLRAALGSLPVNSLPLDRRTLQALQRCGLMQLQDLWRLPVAELRLRFGRPLHVYLAQLKGEQAQMPPRWQPPPHFEAREEFEYPLFSIEQICKATGPLLEHLEQFLKQRHLQTDLLYLILFGESRSLHEAEPAPLQLQIGTRLPGNSAEVFALLIETRLKQVHLSAAVQAIQIRVERYQPSKPDGGVPGMHSAAPKPGSALADLLAARLGADQICCFEFNATHAPESVSRLIGYRSNRQGRQTGASATAHSAFQPLPNGPDAALTPVWLLDPPQRLSFRDQRLFYRSFLQLTRGPQRIESLWWSKQRLRRDYYVAHNEQGMRLWIYRDLGNTDAAEYNRWYLHGLFG